MNDIDSSGELIDYITKDTRKNISYIDKNGKKCILRFKKLAYKNKMSLVRNPLYGDQKYNKNSKVGEQLALFAKRLEFYHPITNELLSFELELPDIVPYNIFRNNKEV